MALVHPDLYRETEEILADVVKVQTDHGGQCSGEWSVTIREWV